MTDTTEAGEPNEKIGAPTADQTDPTTPEKAGQDQPWWDDPSLPWRHKPTRADVVCWAMIAAVGIWGFATIPLRAVLIGWNPPVAAMIMGGRTSVVATGAWTHINGGPLIVYWLLASISLVKFSWVYWWAGHLWGENIISLFAGQSARARRRAQRAVRVTSRWRLLAIFLTFLPVPFPMPIVFAAIGAAGVSLKRFLPPVLVCSAFFQAIYLGLGWWIGQPAVDLVNLYANYMWYFTIVLVAGMIIAWWWRSHRAKGQAADNQTTQPSDGQPQGDD
ncbi:MAG: DedA family protein [Propionibacteriaceae bacterium]|jgi:membrane protein DedA with SNARE-associated domain|nr:DedA family protein [Propionibacteriaceae bacterium]